MGIAGRYLHRRSAAAGAEEVAAEEVQGDSGVLQRSESPESSAATTLTAEGGDVGDYIALGDFDIVSFLEDLTNVPGEACEMSVRELPPVFNAAHSMGQHALMTSTYALSAPLIVQTGVAGTGQPPTDPAAQALPRWAMHLAVPPDEHIAAACAAYGDCRRWRARKPTTSLSSASESSEGSPADHKALCGSVAVDWKRILDAWDRTDHAIWRDSAQLARCGEDVVLFEGVRVVPSILLFLTLQEQKGNDQHQRDAGGGRYKRLMDSIGIAPCDCVEAQVAKARAEGIKEKKIAAMRPSCATSCHRYRLKTAWATRVNRGGKVVDKSKVGSSKGGAAGRGIFSYRAKREQPSAAVAGTTQQAGTVPAPPAHPAQEHAAGWGPASGHTAWAAPPVTSPFQLHNVRREEEEARRGSNDQPLPRSMEHPRGSDEQLSRELPPGGHPAPITLAVRARGLLDGPTWTEATAEGDTPRFVPKRPKNEAPDAHWQQQRGPGYGHQASSTDLALGHPLHGSDDALPWAPHYLAQQEDANRSPPPTASPSQQSQGAVLRYTVSQSSEMSVPAAAAVAAGPEQGGEWDVSPQDAGAREEADKQEVSLADMGPLEMWGSVEQPTQGPSPWPSSPPDAFPTVPAPAAPAAQAWHLQPGNDHVPVAQHRDFQLHMHAQQSGYNGHASPQQNGCAAHASPEQHGYVHGPHAPAYVHHPPQQHQGVQSLSYGQQGQVHSQQFGQQLGGRSQSYGQQPQLHGGFQTPSWGAERAASYPPMPATSMPGAGYLQAHGPANGAPNGHSHGYPAQDLASGASSPYYGNGSDGHFAGDGLPAGFVPTDSTGRVGAASPPQHGNTNGVFAHNGWQVTSGNCVQQTAWQAQPAAQTQSSSTAQQQVGWRNGGGPHQLTTPFASAALPAMPAAHGYPHQVALSTSNYEQYNGWHVPYDQASAFRQASPPISVAGLPLATTRSASRSDSASSVPSPSPHQVHQLGSARAKLTVNTAESALNRFAGGASRMLNHASGSTASGGLHASAHLNKSGSNKSLGARSASQGTVESSTDLGPLPPPTTSQRSISSGGSPPPAAKTPESSGADVVASLTNLFRKFGI